VVEDDPAVRGVLVFLLESVGWQVAAVADSDRGLALARGARPDLIVTDLRLPGRSGIDLAAALSCSTDIPLVAITSDTEHLRDRAVRSGYFTSVLTKPFDLTLFLDTVRDAVGADSPA
jgi:CheY-like chemotaxis protein